VEGLEVVLAPLVLRLPVHLVMLGTGADGLMEVLDDGFGNEPDYAGALAELCPHVVDVVVPHERVREVTDRPHDIG
jgi:hypothetical protein